MTTQLLLMHRYVFVLAGEARSMRRARDLRSFGGRGKELRSAAGMIGTLMLRTFDRSDRIYRAMTARGFTGTLHLIDDERLRERDGIFVLAGSIVCLAFRFAFR
jgi:cobalt/nickel transport system permease protein